MLDHGKFPRHMELRVFRNFRAIRFIRCETPIPGSPYTAGGAALSLPLAIARCESEMIERTFERHELRAVGVIPLGIAAHLDLKRAQEKALQETIETLCLKQMHSEKKMRCIFKLTLSWFTLGVARTSHGYFCFMRGFLGAEPIGAYSAAATLFATVLKTWEEYQNMQFFRPRGALLKIYTKAHKLFTTDELKALLFQFEPRSTYSPDMSGLVVAFAERSGRKIAYYIEKKGRES